MHPSYFLICRNIYAFPCLFAYIYDLSEFPNENIIVNSSCYLLRKILSLKKIYEVVQN